MIMNINNREIVCNLVWDSTRESIVSLIMTLIVNHNCLNLIYRLTWDLVQISNLIIKEGLKDYEY